MPTNNTAEEEYVVENDIESLNSPNSQQLIAARNRPHLSRIGKETIEDNELETINSTNGNLLTNQRSSNRLTKKLRIDPSPIDPTLKKTDPSPIDPTLKKTVTIIKPNTSIGSKTRRPWELWSVEDKNAFFEALCEYGKDFESIQSYIAQRSKKKGIASNMIKNKDQVRHFYYRTWHKISKFLEITGCLRKQTRELYGLINYAELRKKIGGLNEKNSQKLNELVFNGVTTVKHKGKKLRIKTPVCRALKKLNNVSDTNAPEMDKMPKDVVVEFRPHTNFAWYQVQKLSQNPRIRTKVNLQKRLRPVLEHLQKRWRPNRIKKKEQILTSLPASATEEIVCDPFPVLRVKPGRDTKISMLSLSAMNITSSSDVCLQKYLKFAQKTTFDDDMAKSKKNRLKPKTFGDGSVLESNAQKGDLVDETTSFELIENNLSTDNSEISGDALQISKSLNKISSDDTSCTGILTPPKSVPEHEIGPDQALQEAQRSLSLLSSMLNSAKFRNANISPEDEEERSGPSASIGVSNPVNTSTICEEVSSKSDENSDDQSSAPCSLQANQEAFCVLHEDILEKQDDSSSLSDEKLSQSYLNQDNEGFETMTLSQLLNQNIEKQALSPDSSPSLEQCEGDVSGLMKLGEFCKGDVSGLIKLGEFCKGDEGAFQKSVKQGWTAEEAEFLTFGELYLMFGSPSKIILEYEFEQPDAVDNNLSDDESTSCSTDSIAEMSKMLENMFRCACGLFSEDKSKQLPLSPTSRNVLQSRVNTASQTSGKPILRHAVKAPPLKTNIRIKPSIFSEDTLMYTELSQSSKENVTNVSESISTGSKTIATSSDATSSDKHVFVVPVAAPPRSVKPPNQESLREEIGKLLPGTRRGCRVRRKPLVVQRPLLPRDRIRTIAGPRPMTVVHFVPSGSQLTAVIPSSCPAPEKIALPSTNKVVKILSTGSPMDMHPLQVPVMKHVSPDPGNNIALQSSSIGSPHVMINPSQRDSIHLIDDSNLTCSLASINSSNTVQPTNITENSSILDSHSVSDVTLPSQTINSLNLNILTSSACEDSTEGGNRVSSLGSEMHLLDDSTKLPSNLSSITVSSFLKMPINRDFELSPLKEKSTASSSPPITPYTDCDPAFSSKQNTPPDSPTHQPFRINSPEIQWLNGESAELSLNTFLNSMESPNKTSSANSVNLSADNSNLDPIVRLAPVVDSQVRCLLDECSIDFITKFEDLADVINSSCNDSKPT